MCFHVDVRLDLHVRDRHGGTNRRGYAFLSHIPAVGLACTTHLGGVPARARNPGIPISV
jgi:hypothetical protein